MEVLNFFVESPSKGYSVTRDSLCFLYNMVYTYTYKYNQLLYVMVHMHLLVYKLICKLAVDFNFVGVDAKWKN